MLRGFMLQVAAVLLVSVLALDCQAIESGRFGMNTGPRAFQTDTKSISELGIGSVRLPLQWQMVEPRPGQFDWSTTDRIVETAEAKQVQVLFTLRCISSWGTKEQTVERSIYHSASAPKDMNEWTRYVKELATRYRGRGVHYEIDNEVNGPTFWSGTLDEYLELLKASYGAIKEADPQARVLPSAMACKIVRNFKSAGFQSEEWKRHDTWLRAILSTKAFDVVSVHDYYFPSGIVANGLTFQSYLDHIREMMSEAGVADRPIWITETGFVSKPTNASGRLDDGSPQKQAQWLKQAFRQAQENGVERFFWIMVRDRKEAYFGSMGLANADGNPRPAWTAVMQLIKEQSGK